MQAEFESRCELYEAQVTKMQRSLERGDTEKAKIEEDLAKAMALKTQGDRQVSYAHKLCLTSASVVPSVDDSWMALLD